MHTAQRYLPSATAARRALLERASAIEEHLQCTSGATEQAALKEWRDIYRYSFDQNLTGCVVQLEEMEKQAKLIVGEQGYVLSYSDYEFRHGTNFMLTSNSFDDYFTDGARGHVKKE